MTTSARPVHTAIAERGKVFALAGQHDLALRCYRQAMRMTIDAGDPEIVFRHYLDCAVETLERMARYEEVLVYCDRLIGFYSEKHDLDPFWRRDLAATHERRGVVLLKAGRREAAMAALCTALAQAEANDQRLPLAECLLGWLQRGFQVDARRVQAEQERYEYFSVRTGTVDPSRALALDDPLLVSYGIVQ